jgi:hypothetical protein
MSSGISSTACANKDRPRTLVAASRRAVSPKGLHFRRIAQLSTPNRIYNTLDAHRLLHWPVREADCRHLRSGVSA